MQDTRYPAWMNVNYGDNDAGWAVDSAVRRMDEFIKGEHWHERRRSSTYPFYKAMHDADKLHVVLNYLVAIESGAVNVWREIDSRFHYNDRPTNGKPIPLTYNNAVGKINLSYFNEFNMDKLAIVSIDKDSITFHDTIAELPTWDNGESVRLFLGDACTNY